MWSTANVTFAFRSSITTLETKAHVLQCEEIKMKNSRKIAWDTLKNVKNKVHPTILKHMWYGLGGGLVMRSSNRV